MNRLEGKVAVVTGAASNPGMGNSIARMMAAEGAAVAVTDIDAPGVRQTAEQISSSGGTCIALTHDVASEEQWVATLEQVVSTFGKIDVLVNNAGIVTEVPSLEETSLELWERELRINLTSVFLGCKHVVGHMRKAKGGSIVNISSVSGLVGFGHGPYGASKGGVRLLTKCVALQYGKENIRCNSVHPGITQTNMANVVFRGAPERKDAFAATMPLRRLGLPDDIANCVVFLASDESAYATGAEFIIDGGMTAQ